MNSYPLMRLLEKIEGNIFHHVASCWLKLAIANKHEAILDITVQMALWVWSCIILLCLSLLSLFFSQHVTEKMFHRFCQKSKTGTFHLGKCDLCFFFFFHYLRERRQRKQGLFSEIAILAKPCPYSSLEWTNQALALERAYGMRSTCLKGGRWREVYVLS